MRQTNVVTYKTIISILEEHGFSFSEKNPCEIIYKKNDFLVSIPKDIKEFSHNAILSISKDSHISVNKFYNYIIKKSKIHHPSKKHRPHETSKEEGFKKGHGSRKHYK